MAASSISVPQVNHDRGGTILSLTWTEGSLAILIVCARIYARVRLVKNEGWDDWIMLFALVLAVICNIFVTLEVHYGIGRHIATLSPYQTMMAIKMVWMTQPFSTMSACFGKISIALQLRRILSKSRPHKNILWTVIVSLFIVNLLCVIVTFAQCTPVTSLWHRGTGNCWDPIIQQDFGYVQASYSSFTDLVLAIYPVLIIWKLQMDRTTKIALSCLMSLGVFAGATAIVKTVMLKYLTSNDFTYDTVDLVCWYMTENYVIIIAACAPTLKPLYIQGYSKAVSEIQSIRLSASQRRVSVRMSKSDKSGDKDAFDLPIMTSGEVA